MTIGTRTAVAMIYEIKGGADKAYIAVPVDPKPASAGWFEAEFYATDIEAAHAMEARFGDKTIFVNFTSDVVMVVSYPTFTFEEVTDNGKD